MQTLTTSTATTIRLFITCSLLFGCSFARFLRPPERSFLFASIRKDTLNDPLLSVSKPSLSVLSSSRQENISIPKLLRVARPTKSTSARVKAKNVLAISGAKSVSSNAISAIHIDGTKAALTAYAAHRAASPV